MPGGAVTGLSATNDIERIEAPVTWKAYVICAFASFGGIFFGYDSGYINGVIASPFFYKQIEGQTATGLSPSNQSLVVSILSAGTFIGALIAGDSADMIGRRFTIILGCAIYTVGVILQIVSSGLGLIVAGRFVAGLGVGFESAIVILYMSEIAPRKVRGALVSGYQFAITLGILLASGVNYATQDYPNKSSYQIPIGLQFAWGAILAAGLFWLPESPRYFVKRGKVENARLALGRLRGQPASSEYIEAELAEIIANEEYERALIPSSGWVASWLNTVRGSPFKSGSNMRRTILGTALQMFQQLTGVNFIFYYSTPFLKSTGAIGNPFLISLIFNLVNVCSTPVSFVTMEKLGRRANLIYGAAGMLICQFVVGIIGVTVGFNKTHTILVNGVEELRANNISAVNAQIAFIAIYIFFFATTWGPGAWVVIGEIFPLPIRSRGVALSTASNWLWNTIIAVITPYLTGAEYANMRSSIFFLWGGLCTTCLIFAYFFIPETKGLSLEQVDRMFEETTPRTSAKWKPHTTYARDAGMDGKMGAEMVADVERKGSAF